MKNINLNPEDRLVKNVSSAIREFNVTPIESQLKLEDYQKLLVSQFVNHVKVEHHGLNEDEYMYRDGVIISSIKEALGSIKSEAERCKTSLRGYKVTLIRDKNGLCFSFIVLPRDIHRPIDSEVIKELNQSLNVSFNTAMTEEPLRTVFKLSPRSVNQPKFLKNVGLPMFALSLGLELDWEDKKFEINFLWNERDRIDSSGFYVEV